LQGIHSAAHSSELGSGVDVSTAELQRAGFAQDEMVLVVRDGDDTDGLLGNNAGGPVPMRVKIDDGRLVLDPDGFKQHGASLKLCQVVTGANGERTIRELPGRTGEQHTGGNAPVPVSQVANPAPAAIAAMPGGAASTANGGIRENESNETMADLTASLSPPMKKRRFDPPSNEAVAGEFADLVPIDFDCGWRTRGEMESSVRFDVRESITEWVAEVLKRFWIWVNPAVTEPPLLETSFSGRGYHARVLEQNVAAASRELVSMVHPLTHSALVASQLHFPELRLIEYDCGKLQALSRLLRRLYALKHRCLIFTQMSRMLDVLQAFLSYHGYQYFRLDGTTGIEQRQAMMERFNADTRIFCFILSTRSGGVGVNLTGADTVIFYDSDWNPTMDAQAQDRCHRIGQTRNVTIFRLISEKTIEENILRKANQKRRLGEMAIDDAGFTPEFFKQSDNLRDLFDGDVEVGDIDDRPKSQKDVEKAMATVEDEQDVTAAKMVLLEAKADTAEFDENARTAEASGTFVSYLDSEEPLDEKYIELISQLKPIERYAVNFLEAEYKPDFDEEVKEAEAMIDQKREDWVRAHNKALSNGDVEMEVDDNSSRVDDDFYGAGILLDEVRSRRKIRVTASSGAVAARTAPSRHSVRLAAPQPQKPSPSKTLSGRRIIAPHALAVPLNSPRSVSASIAPQKSAAHTAARSAVRKAAVRATTQRRKRIAADNDSQRVHVRHL
uniref:Helicase domino (inferred by orthology to a D. melanogaster protein) n=1 Tax=Nippostrongylus brasiliensis TaxID=27835 RepID=A0A0N4YYC4_NIPBR